MLKVHLNVGDDIIVCYGKLLPALLLVAGKSRKDEVCHVLSGLAVAQNSSVA